MARVLPRHGECILVRRASPRADGERPVKIAIALMLGMAGITMICLGTIFDDVGAFALGAACVVALMLMRP